ncbi:PREDICTED: hemagglutinin/amebocyte aggregation factor-like [Nanorana parkeri]|uniref:hemagglutinin/amebocyte aggregation factor-like n=1 Tax=Nanorana parkeri TaxID=125878 RepID=UPI0008549B8C|nr:PREDICTED: hemagglutinin/amebocyte aggregation factor-like [Nanorana parkeri]
MTAMLKEEPGRTGEAPQERWVNAYDQPLTFQCQQRQSISMVISIHDNGREDRMWDFSCKNTFNSATCTWSGYVNNFDQEFSYTCPFGSVITGVDSYHDNKAEDRRWRFLCCQGEVKATRNCKWSGYVNNFDGYLRWDAPANAYLTGAHSYHDNSKEDRRWNFYYCEKM